MKIDSHLLGIGVGLAIIGYWMWSADKEVGRFNGWTIWKIGGKFFVEYVSGTKDQNPSFSSMEEAQAWITANDKSNHIPWGQ